MSSSGTPFHRPATSEAKLKQLPPRRITSRGGSVWRVSTLSHACFSALVLGWDSSLKCSRETINSGRSFSSCSMGLSMV